jgi:hypothetical protein
MVSAISNKSPALFYIRTGLSSLASVWFFHVWERLIWIASRRESRKISIFHRAIKVMPVVQIEGTFVSMELNALLLVVKANISAISV